jgi:hypothetical protein
LGIFTDVKKKTTESKPKPIEFDYKEMKPIYDYANNLYVENVDGKINEKEKMEILERATQILAESMAIPAPMLKVYNAGFTSSQEYFIKKEINGFSYFYMKQPPNLNEVEEKAGFSSRVLQSLANKGRRMTLTEILSLNEFDMMDYFKQKKRDKK